MKIEKILNWLEKVIGNYCICSLCGEEKPNHFGGICEECFKWMVGYDNERNSVSDLREKDFLTAEEFKIIRDKIKTEIDCKIENNNHKTADKLKKKYGIKL